MDQVPNVETNLLYAYSAMPTMAATLLEEEVEGMTTRLTSLARRRRKSRNRHGRIDEENSITACRAPRKYQNLKRGVLGCTVNIPHKCQFCNRKFKSNKTMLLHRDSCVHQYNTTDEVYVIEEIIGAFGWVDAR